MNLINFSGCLIKINFNFLFCWSAVRGYWFEHGVRCDYSKQMPQQANACLSIEFFQISTFFFPLNFFFRLPLPIFRLSTLFWFYEQDFTGYDQKRYDLDFWHCRTYSKGEFTQRQKLLGYLFFFSGRAKFWKKVSIQASKVQKISRHGSVSPFFRPPRYHQVWY